MRINLIIIQSDASKPIINDVNAELERTLKDGTFKQVNIANAALAKAEKSFGLNHKVLRILADILLILSCFAVVGLAIVGIKKAHTGHSFFFFGRQDEKQVVQKLAARLEPRPSP